MNQSQADALIRKIASDLSPENAKRLKSAIKPVQQVGSETISIGVWPNGDGPSQKPEKESPSNGEEFNDSATDDERSEDDYLKLSRDTHDMALQHLIEGGLDPATANTFLDLLPEHASEDQNSFVDALTWLSGRIAPREPTRNIPFPSAGGTRN